MFDFSNIGLRVCLYDDDKGSFSNVSLGLLIRALGHNLKVAYLDVGNSSQKLINFFENVSLNKSFKKFFHIINLELFTFLKNDKISREIIPLVEYNTFDKKYLSNFLKKDFDIIIFDNVNLNVLSEKDISFLSKLLPKITDLVFIFNDIKDFNKIKKKDYFNGVFEYKIKKNEGLTNTKTHLIIDKKLTNSIYSLGKGIKNYIEKDDLKYIVFDRDSSIFGEYKFFKFLKEFSKTDKIYGSFDYVDFISGYDDKAEVLDIVLTTIKKNNTIFLDNIFSMFNLNELKFVNSMIEKSLPSEIFISINKEQYNKDLERYFHELYMVKEIKDLKHEIRRGLNF